LLKAVFEELEAEKYYGGYKLESANPRNVSFYERNKFMNLVAANICGLTITILVRLDLHKTKQADAPPSF
jgi:hypothetical protein